jgi:UDP-2-acetamido-3-amino-2,3-dideoxy-glucuronate N-acetyltransferase
VTVFVHPQGICESTHVGDGTRVWAFSHILAGARIGRDCNICDHVFIEDDVVVGDRVTIKCGVQLWNGLVVGDDVFIGPNATFTNDRFPRSKRQVTPLRTQIEAGASLSANCTILPGVTIGRDAMVGAGAVVTHDVPARAIVIGSPATIVGYVDAVTLPSPEVAASGVHELIGGASLVHLEEHTDLRGSLVAAHLSDQVPFTPKRFFVVYNVPGKDVRGEHAHRACQQFLVCVHGSLSLLLDDGEQRQEIRLEAPTVAVYIPPMVWSVQYRFSDDAVLVVLASDEYDPEDYIRDYEEFLRVKGDRSA